MRFWLLVILGRFGERRRNGIIFWRFQARLCTARLPRTCPIPLCRRKWRALEAIYGRLYAPCHFWRFCSLDARIRPHPAIPILRDCIHQASRHIRPSTHPGLLPRLRLKIYTTTVTTPYPDSPSLTLETPIPTQSPPCTPH